MIKDSLKLIRKTKGISQKGLAKLLSISNKTVSHWELGYSEPSLEMLKRLKQVLDASYEELLD